jgi:hypothetical protein
LLPDVACTIKTWREEAAKHGLELYICRFESYLTGGKEYLRSGFDAAIDFQPWGASMAKYKSEQIKHKQQAFSFRVKNFFYREVAGKFSQEKYRTFRREFKEREMSNYIIDYNDYVNFLSKEDEPNYKRYPCVMPMWDNTPRLKTKLGVFYNSSPALYRNWLSDVLKKFKPYSEEENFVFINAWNEWGEGNHLEPCQKWGHQYLQATREALEDQKNYFTF